MVQAPTLQVLTANRLRDGDVVYWAEGRWNEGFGRAEVFSDKEAAARALESAQAFVRAGVVVNPYLFAVRGEAGGLRPAEEREIVRSNGPSVRRDLGKQAGRRNAPNVNV